jgi:pre-mRNA-splicing factor RBM22/SLT11
MAQQNIKDRFYGSNDPVAKKMITRTDEEKELRPPEDPAVTSIFLSGVDEAINEGDVR